MKSAAPASFGELSACLGLPEGAILIAGGTDLKVRLALADEAGP